MTSQLHVIIKDRGNVNKEMQKVNTVKSKMTRQYQHERKHKDYDLCEIQYSYKFQTIRIYLFLFH